MLVPDQPQPRLTTLSDRIELLEQAGADHVLILHTTPQLLHLTAAEFFHQVLVQRLQAVAFVEGQNFGFGRQAPAMSPHWASSVLARDSS